MDHYQDLKILADPEFPPSILMNALFAKLHRVLVKLESKHTGVSFPEVVQGKPFLGQVLRIHGSAELLKNLQGQNWLKGMRDHLEVSEIQAIPADTKHCRVRRVQAKSNVERLRRRYLKRHQGVSEEKVAELIPNSIEKRLNLPFIQMKSESTAQHFRLFIEHQPAQQHAVEGKFNSYGLSTEATIPWF